MSILPLKLEILCEGRAPSRQSPIQAIPDEILEHILFLTDLSDTSKTRLVSRKWNVLTLSGCKNAVKRDLDQLFRLLIENLDLNKRPQNESTLSYLLRISRLLNENRNPNKHPRAYLKRIQTGFHNFLQSTPLNPAQYHRLFLTVQGLILRVLYTLPMQERNQLQQTISHQTPPSLIHLFEVPNVEEVILKGDFDTFYSLLHARNSSLIWCLEHVAHAGQIRMLRTMLAMGLVSDVYRSRAVFGAAYRNHPECLQLLLANGPIDERWRGDALYTATANKNLGILRLILNHGQISEDDRGSAVVRAACDNHPESASLLLANGPISEAWRKQAIRNACRHNNEELLQLLDRDTTLIAPLVMDFSISLKARITIGKLLLPSWKTVARVAFTVLTGIKIFPS
jgi:hypothetical protein